MHRPPWSSAGVTTASRRADGRRVDRACPTVRVHVSLPCLPLDGGIDQSTNRDQGVDPATTNPQTHGARLEKIFVYFSRTFGVIV